MERTPKQPRVGNWFAGTAIAVAVGLVLVVILALTGALFDSADDLVTVLLAGVAVVALTGWWQDKLARAERDRVEESEREQESHDRSRLIRARDTERKWARELRSQLAHMHKQQGTLARTGDVRELVLETAVRLVDADRGLLLSRRDDDGDGDFDMACQTGFQADATHSAVAQEYAGKVLHRDEVVREDDSRQLRGEGRNPADDEIQNLLAVPIFIQDDFEGVVLCANREGGFEDLDDDVLLALGDHAGAVLENGRLQGEARSTYMAIVRMLAEAIEAKDPATRMHSEDVAEYVRGVADGLGLESRKREELLIASLLHDVGKIGVSERILLKPAALTPDEREAIELHSRIGYHLVRQVPALHGIADAVLHHHERWDGDGYPNGLAGDQIPLDARVISVADSFSAMTSNRPYREAMDVDAACQELERCAGGQFDPRVVDLFVEQVRAHPPGQREGAQLEGALADPEVQAHLEPGEPVLGYGPSGAVDNLTLLYGHRHLHEQAARLSEDSQVAGVPYSVLLVELTSLPEINEREGYAAGDRAIVQVARVVADVAAGVGGTACRYGGRRLAVLAPSISGEGAAAMGRDVERTLEADGLTVRTAGGEWRPGDPPTAAVSRARLALGTGPLTAPPTPS